MEKEERLFSMVMAKLVAIEAELEQTQGLIVASGMLTEKAKKEANKSIRKNFKESRERFMEVCGDMCGVYSDDSKNS